LADTGPLYAAVDQDDQYHPRAQSDLGRLAREELAVVVIYPILLESYTLVMRRLGTPQARRWLDDLTRGATLNNPTAEDYLVALRRLRGYRDQPLTLFDTVLDSVAAGLQLPVWTYDHHFDLLRTAVWR
jgi:predicted nucleic acid-binding protein